MYLVRNTPWYSALPVVLVSAGVHGDEPAGVYAAIKLLQLVVPQHRHRFNFVVLPCVNPTGFDNHTLETADGANLNRIFGTGSLQPEVRTIEQWLADTILRFCVTFDLHETRPDYEGEGFQKSDNPLGCYLYETATNRKQRIGRQLIEALPPSMEVSREPKIYLDDNSNGVIYYPEACHNPIYRQNTTFDAYLNGRYTNHSFTTETPTDWKLEKRVEAHLTWLVKALELLTDFI